MIPELRRKESLFQPDLKGASLLWNAFLCSHNAQLPGIHDFQFVRLEQKSFITDFLNDVVHVILKCSCLADKNDGQVYVLPQAVNFFSLLPKQDTTITQNT
jgi:hypothetical protein